MIWLLGQFENDVEMYGAQTGYLAVEGYAKFENDVEMYGAQTAVHIHRQRKEFENDVEMYGAQTTLTGKQEECSLRMMQKCMVLKQWYK